MDKDVPYIVYESEAARHERTVKRLLVALAVTIVLLFASNIAWLCFFSQFDISDTAVTLDSQDEGTNSYIKNGGEITNGSIDN